MDLNSILESISKEQTKPRLKERPLSESEIIRAYSIITEERYNLIAEDSRMKINELLSYGEESDDDIKEAEKYNPNGEETDDDIKEAEKYDPNPKRKMKTALGRAWTIIKKLIKALIDILKSLIQKVLNVFKKKKKDIEDAVEVEIQTYNEIKETLLLEYIPNNETKVYPIITDVVGDFNFFGYRNIAFDKANEIKTKMSKYTPTTIDNCMEVFSFILDNAKSASTKLTYGDLNNPTSENLAIIKKELGCTIKMITVDELINAKSKKNNTVLDITRSNLKKFSTVISGLEEDVKIYIKYLDETDKRFEFLTPSDRYTSIDFRKSVNDISRLFTGFNSVVTYMTSFYYKFSASTINLIRDAKTKILEGGNK